MAKQTQDKADPGDVVVVTIAVDNHEHNGIAIPKGATLEVDRDTAAWMLQQNIIEG